MQPLTLNVGTKLKSLSRPAAIPPMSALMEKRATPRIPVHVEVRYVVLGRDSGTLPAYACDVSEYGLRLVTEIELNRGEFVRIHLEDSTLFGEVKYCYAWMNEYVSGVYVEEVLLGDSELAKLISTTMSQVPKMTPAVNHPL